MTLSSWPDSRVSGWYLDDGLLGPHTGGSQMEIWPRPWEAQTQGLLTVSFPPGTSVPTQSLCLVTVYRTVSGCLQESVTIRFWGSHIGTLDAADCE